MNAPFYQLDAFGYPVAMALATVLGIGFGFVLERSGFARSNVLAAQFYGRDMRVLKVMFSAIATAAVGLALLGAVGAVDLGALKIPETWLWPQVVGGLLAGRRLHHGRLLPGHRRGGDGIRLRGRRAHARRRDARLACVRLRFPCARALLPIERDGRRHAAGAAARVLVVGRRGRGRAGDRFVLARREGRACARAEGRRLAPRRHRDHAQSRLHRDGRYGGPRDRRPVAARPAVTATAPRATPISTTELGQQLAGNSASLYLVDTRNPAECAKARIPGALCLDRRQDLHRASRDAPARAVRIRQSRSSAQGRRLVQGQAARTRGRLRGLGLHGAASRRRRPSNPRPRR